MSQRNNRPGFIRILLSLLLAIPASATAGAYRQIGEQQDKEKAAQPEPPSQAKTEDVTPKLIESRVRQLDEAKNLDEESRNKIKELYKQAQEELQLASGWKNRLAQLEAAKKENPERIARLKQLLAEPKTDDGRAIANDAPLADLEKRLVQSETELNEAQKLAAKWEAEPKERDARKRELPGLLQAARKRLDDLNKQMASPPENGGAELEQARRIMLLARKRSIEAQIKALEAEAPHLDSIGELSALERDLAVRTATSAKSRFENLRKRVNEQRQIEAEREARRLAQEAANAIPAIQAIAAENAKLAAHRKSLAGELEKASDQLAAANEELARMLSRIKSVKERVELVGHANSVSVLLRQERTELPSVRGYEEEIFHRQLQLSSLLDALLTNRELRSKFDLDREFRKTSEMLDPNLNDFEREEAEKAIRDALTTQRRLLYDTIRDGESLLSALVDLDAKQRQIVAKTEEFSKYIAERILWVRSTGIFDLAELKECVRSLRSLGDPSHLSELSNVVAQDFRRFPIGNGLALFGFGVLLVMQQRIRRRLKSLGERVSRRYTETFSDTLIAIVLTAMIAAVWPAFMVYVAWRLNQSPLAGEFTKALAAGLRGTAIPLLIFETIRQLCRPNGVADSHFRWKPHTLKVLRSNIYLLVVTVLPMNFLSKMLEWSGYNNSDESLSRLAFMLAYVAMSVIMYFVLRQKSGVIDDLISSKREGWSYKFRQLLCPIAVIVPLGFAVAACIGFYFTAVQLEKLLTSSLGLALGIMLVNAVLLRWLYAARGKLAIKQARERRAAANESPDDASTTVLSSVIKQVDLSAVNLQTRRLMQSGMVFILVVGLWAIWADVLPAAGILRQVQIWDSVVTVSEKVTDPTGTPILRSTEKIVPITLADVGFALIALLMTVIASRNIPGLLEITILPHLPLDAGGRYAVTAVTRYLITLIGIVAACFSLGFSWGKVQWLAAAISVGLGFGLQEIFANFIAGLILLFERPIRVGDVVTVGEISGSVSRIRIRATTITDWDRKDLIVPNKEFITGRVVNWTLTDRVLRVVVKVGVAYGSDVELVERLLYEAAAEHPNVIAEPKTSVTFDSFGDSSLNFVLRTFVDAIENSLKTRHELHAAINRKFAMAGIEIPFPQRDLRIRDADADVLRISSGLKQVS